VTGAAGTAAASATDADRHPCPRSARASRTGSSTKDLDSQASVTETASRPRPAGSPGALPDQVVKRLMTG
jgi:hypothetical protein